MTSPFETKWNPQGTGALYSTLFKSEEDHSFTGDDEKAPTEWSLFSQDWKKFTYHTDATLTHRFSNAGANKTMVADLTKAPDFMFKTAIYDAWPGLKPNSQKGITVKKSHWVNSRGFHYHKSHKVKIATQPLFQVDCHQAQLLLELSGLAEAYAPYVGLCMNMNELLEQSSKATITITPFVGFPFHKDPSTAFNIGNHNYILVN
jgi:hypothetical protein